MKYVPRYLSNNLLIAPVDVALPDGTFEFWKNLHVVSLIVSISIKIQASPDQASNGDPFGVAVIRAPLKRGQPRERRVSP